VHRLVVDPARFRRGIGRRLLEAVEARAPRPGRVIVSTGAANAPARALYQTAGYAEVGRVEVAPGILLSSFEKRLEKQRRDARVGERPV
jgi:GNAT superfamily N-acetyltransferase